MQNNEEVARVMYTTYCIGVGGKAHDGNPLPEAEDFFSDPTKEKQANAWRMAVEVAYVHIIGDMM